MGVMSIAQIHRIIFPVLSFAIAKKIIVSDKTYGLAE